MTEEQKYNLLKDVVEAIDEIKAECVKGVIKGYVIPPVVISLMKRYVGFSVILQLDSRFDYNNEVLTKWKNMLKADEWFISVKRNQLRVTFMGTIMTHNPLNKRERERFEKSHQEFYGKYIKPQIEEYYI